ncbi:MAG: hypothetical protein L6V88_04025 [Anaerotruncus sp.]|nr:MAG: hypothetical protein L6V88_04025 [Anaerotruncus sp.]
MKKEEFSALPQLVRDYLTYLEAIKCHSEQSVIEYASDLRTFFQIYDDRKKGAVDKDTEENEIDLSPIDANFIKSIKLTDAHKFF